MRDGKRLPDSKLIQLRRLDVRFTQKARCSCRAELTCAPGIDDDGGWWLNSFVDRTLNVGHYIAAIGAYDLTGAEAASGINSGSGSWSHGNYTLRIESRDGTARATAVSEPGTIGMFGAGLLALALIRRRKAATQ